MPGSLFREGIVHGAPTSEAEVIAKSPTAPPSKDLVNVNKIAKLTPAGRILMVKRVQSGKSVQDVV